MKIVCMLVVMFSAADLLAADAGGWILWTNSYAYVNGKTTSDSGELWQPIDGYPTYAACESVQSRVTANQKKKDDARSADQVSYTSQTASCFPSDFDPRPRSPKTLTFSQ